MRKYSSDSSIRVCALSSWTSDQAMPTRPRFCVNYLDRVWFMLFTPGERDNGSPWDWYCGLLNSTTTSPSRSAFRQWARAKAKNLDRCTALVSSVYHVPVVGISRGSMSHSDPIRLLAADCSDKEGFMNALRLSGTISLIRDDASHRW